MLYNNNAKKSEGIVKILHRGQVALLIIGLVALTKAWFFGGF